MRMIYSARRACDYAYGCTSSPSVSLFTRKLEDHEQLAGDLSLHPAVPVERRRHLACLGIGCVLRNYYGCEICDECETPRHLGRLASRNCGLTCPSAHVVTCCLANAAAEQAIRTLERNACAYQLPGHVRGCCKPAWVQAAFGHSYHGIPLIPYTTPHPTRRPNTPHASANLRHCRES